MILPASGGTRCVPLLLRGVTGESPRSGSDAFPRACGASGATVTRAAPKRHEPGARPVTRCSTVCGGMPVRGLQPGLRRRAIFTTSTVTVVFPGVVSIVWRCDELHRRPLKSSPPWRGTTAAVVAPTAGRHQHCSSQPNGSQYGTSGCAAPIVNSKGLGDAIFTTAVERRWQPAAMRRCSA